MLFSGSANADGPRVVADIAPIHSLVSMVMDGVGQPQLLVPQNISPHHYSMRPSEAEALQEAQLVVYVGHDMSPWLEPVLETLAASASALDLSKVDNIMQLAYREGPIFDGHDEEGHDDHDEEGHDDHDEEGHDDHAHHDHDGVDPHMWLDPMNAKLWLYAIASELTRIDPKNADRYDENARSSSRTITLAMAQAEGHLASGKDNGFLVYHDAYQYFEKRFNRVAVGSISLGDASKPSAKRLSELKALFGAQGISCVLTEPQYSSKIVDSVFGGFKPTIGVVDPIGIDLELGTTLYPQLLENIALSIAQCVNP
ncbi:MAG: zinc ABC transporter substrate-binding protein [Gammaproteobacteria bacterium]|nr:zinc ABC transporter substrate-binding protein [Gammaproteobacteria bacterium]